MAQKSFNQQSEEKRDDFKTLFLGSERGRKVLSDLRRESGYDDELFDKNSDSATAYQCGKRELFRYILTWIGDQND
jgi:hypothetical protein